MKKFIAAAALAVLTLAACGGEPSAEDSRKEFLSMAAKYGSPNEVEGVETAESFCRSAVSARRLQGMIDFYTIPDEQRSDFYKMIRLAVTGFCPENEAALSILPE